VLIDLALQDRGQIGSRERSLRPRFNKEGEGSPGE
jgi:hypothetical protein